MSFKTKLIKHLIHAEDKAHFKVLKDRGLYKQLMRMYELNCMGENQDFSRVNKFLSDIDAILYKYCKLNNVELGDNEEKPEPTEDELDVEEEDFSGMPDIDKKKKKPMKEESSLHKRIEKLLL